ncbi:MAG: DUF3817 domain-containing protein [Planctomycetota bacterium]
MAADIDRDFLKRLRVVGFVEGVSTLVLFFVAMPLKYGADMPLAVTIAGSIHGLLFSTLVGFFVVAADKVPLPRKLVAWGIVGAIFPFGPFVVDRRLARL